MSFFASSLHSGVCTPCRYELSNIKSGSLCPWLQLLPIGFFLYVDSLCAVSTIWYSSSLRSLQRSSTWSPLSSVLFLPNTVFSLTSSLSCDGWQGFLLPGSKHFRHFLISSGVSALLSTGRSTMHNLALWGSTCVIFIGSETEWSVFYFISTVSPRLHEWKM